MEIDGPTSTPNSGEERRRSERVPSDRSIRYSDYQALGPLRDGKLTDISSTGFQVHTDYPEEQGSLLQIEMLPGTDEPADNIILFEGRVIHVEKLSSGSHAMGVRRIQKALSDPSILTMHTTEPHETPPKENSVPRPENDQAVRFRKVEPKNDNGKSSKKLSMWFMVLAGSLFLLALGGTIAASHTINSKMNKAYTTPPTEVELAEVEEQVLESGSNSGLSSGSPEAVAPTSVELDSIADFREFDSAMDFSSLPPTEQLPFTDSDPIDDYRSFLVRAHALEQEGQNLAARGWAHRAVAIREPIPAPWKKFAREYIRHLIAAPGSEDFRWMEDFVPLERVAQHSISNADLQLEVDTRSFVLTVKKNGSTIHQFPIGLGRFSTTPNGNFQIANKLSNPDWIDGGTVVPYGDPRNPIGDYWMGLGVNAVPTSYGIHPTEDSASIGKTESQGCVRMRPADAESLFRLVPIGTPVTIY